MIWPYYNPMELHSQDADVWKSFEAADRARREESDREMQLAFERRRLESQDAAAERERQRKIESQAVRQQGLMEFNNLVSSGISPEIAFARAADKLYRDVPDQAEAVSTWHGLKPKLPLKQFRTLGDKIYSINPETGENTAIISKEPTAGDMTEADRQLYGSIDREYNSTANALSKLPLDAPEAIVTPLKTRLINIRAGQRAIMQRYTPGLVDLALPAGTMNTNTVSVVPTGSKGPIERKHAKEILENNGWNWNSAADEAMKEGYTW